MPFDADLVEPRKRREQAGLLLWREARAVVAYPEAHHRDFGEPFGYAQDRLSRAVDSLTRRFVKAQFNARRLTAVFQSVAEVVGPYLLDPGAVAQHHRPGLGQHNLGLRCLDLMGQPLLGFGHDTCHVQRSHFHFHLAHFGQQ